jgi:hypothetical protein
MIISPKEWAVNQGGLGRIHRGGAFAENRPTTAPQAYPGEYTHSETMCWLNMLGKIMKESVMAQKSLRERFSIISDPALAIIFYVDERKIGRFPLLRI